jgi:hypothetical protein
VVEDEASLARGPRTRDAAEQGGRWRRDRSGRGGGGYAGPAGGGAPGTPRPGTRSGVTPRPDAAGAPARSAEAPEAPGADGYIRGLAERRKGKEVASGEKPAEGKKAEDPFNLGLKVGQPAAEADDKEVDAVEEQTREAEKMRRAYFGSSIELSKHVKALREARSAGDRIGGTIIRRVGNRTFYHRFGLYVEAPILDLEAKEIDKRLVRIEAFSPEYFALLKKTPNLSGVLALGNSLLFLDGEKIVQIVPAGTLSAETGK